MNILIHDYSGHPFQAQLSRELARRGHVVDHVHCASYISGKGRLETAPGDPTSLTFTSLDLKRSFDKYAAWRRLPQELSYARQFLAHVELTRPDVVVMCNVPLLAHSVIDRRLHKLRVPTVFWHQDVYSNAIGLEAERRLGPFGGALAHAADRAERKIALRARSVVAISDQFLAVHRRWGTADDKIRVIPNWGPLDEVTPRPRNNAWASSHDLVGSPVMLYSGTLGLKHDARHLISLLREVRKHLSDARLVVVSTGPATDRLRDRDEPGLTVLPFQPFDVLPDVLGSADVLVTILEPEASQYSSPSKTLTYLCAGRPVLALVPAANQTYAIVNSSGGLAIDPIEENMAVTASTVAQLLANPHEVERRGRLARGFAEATFGIAGIAIRFEEALGGAPGRDQEPRRARHRQTAPAMRRDGAEVRGA
jgi:glycosyltransferase involved in cell wall biosynthesis